MPDTIYKCNSGSIKAFPLNLQLRTTPIRRSDYEAAGVDILEGLIDFQWAPQAVGLTTMPSTTGSILLQSNDAASSVLYNTLRYTVENVQITSAQHSNWLIAGSQINTQDLIILLRANSPASSTPVYIIFVIPILNNGTALLDPEYLKNINKSTSGAGIESCFPKEDLLSPGSAPLFAHYVTCFDGYTEHAHTQNIEIFVSTVGLPVSSATLATILGDTTPGVIELPVTISNLYYIPSTGENGSTGSKTAAQITAEAMATAARAAGARADAGGVTTISVSDFPKYITITSFRRGISNIGRQKSTRNDPTSAYQCVELDPESVDANKNIHIDLKSGKIASSTLDDILAERAVIKEMLSPNDAVAASQSPYRKYFEFALAILIILLTFFGLMYYFDNYDTIHNRSISEIFFMFIIALAFIFAASLGILSSDDNLKGIGGWLAFAGVIASFLFYMWYFVIFPPPLTTECGTAVLNLSSTMIGTLTKITVEQAKSMDAIQAKAITQTAAENMTTDVAAAFCYAAAAAIPQKIRDKIPEEARKALKSKSTTTNPITNQIVSTAISASTGGWSTPVLVGGATIVGLLGFILGHLV